MLYSAHIINFTYSVKTFEVLLCSSPQLNSGQKSQILCGLIYLSALARVKLDLLLLMKHNFPIITSLRFSV